MEKEHSLLIVALDMNRAFWMDQANAQVKAEDKARVCFSTALEAAIVYMNAFSLMHRLNKLCFIAMGTQESKMIVPGEDGSIEKFRSDVFLAARRTDRLLREQELAQFQAKQELAQLPPNPSEQPEKKGETQKIKLAQALSKGLCYANRLKLMPKHDSLKVHIVVLMGSNDPSAQYNALMNTVFGAQRIAATIDCIALGQKESTFLQQVAYLTGGVYLKPDDQSNLLQYLLTFCLPSQHTRKMLKFPKHEQVDFRASCFCHKNPVDIAFVCSVCVSVFCRFSPECPTCGTRARPKKIKC